MLRLGPSSVVEIAQETRLNRPTVYSIINSLQQKGLVSDFHKNKKRYFVAEDPKNIQKILEAREIELKSKKEDFQKLLPELQRLFIKSVEAPKVRFYEGDEGLKLFRNEVKNLIEKSSPYTQSMTEIIPYYKIFKRRPDYKDISIKLPEFYKTLKDHKIIYIADNQLNFQNPCRNFKALFVPYDRFPVAIELIILADTVLMLNYPIGISISDKNFSGSFKLLFNNLWDHLNRPELLQ